jgi:hypothetical protein
MSLARFIHLRPKLVPKDEPEFTPLPPLPPIPDKEIILAALKDEAKLTALFPKIESLTTTLANLKDVDVRSQLMHGITSYPKLFEQLFTKVSQITFIADDKCKISGGILINYVIHEAAQFNRLIKSKISLPSLLKSFPCHATIFNQPNIHRAKTASRIKSYMYYLSLFKLRLGHEYKSIPGPVLLQIAAQAAAPDHEKADYEFAMNTFKLSH